MSTAVSAHYSESLKNDKPTEIVRIMIYYIEIVLAFMGCIAACILLFVSTSFNFQFGMKRGGLLLAFGCAAMDISAVHCIFLSRRIDSRKLKALTWVFVFMLFICSLWAGLSFMVSNDYQKKSSVKDYQGTYLSAKKELELAQIELTSSQNHLDSARDSYDNTTIYKKRRQGDINEAKKARREAKIDIAKAKEEMEIAQENLIPEHLAIHSLLNKVTGIPTNYWLIIDRIFWMLMFCSSGYLIFVFTKEAFNLNGYNPENTNPPGNKITNKNKTEEKLETQNRKVLLSSVNDDAKFASDKNKKTKIKSRKKAQPVSLKDEEKRYQKLVKLILSGTVKPSTRGVKKSNLGIGSDYAEQFLRRMVQEGYIVRLKQGHRLTTETERAQKQLKAA